MKRHWEISKFTGEITGEVYVTTDPAVMRALAKHYRNRGMFCANLESDFDPHHDHVLRVDHLDEMAWVESDDNFLDLLSGNNVYWALSER
jgi:hypothetical protein